jgi:hypothetical protein
MSNKTTDQLKFNTELFTKECIEIVNINLQDRLTKIYDELKTTFDSQLKSEVMRKIGCDDLYNYDELEISGLQMGEINHSGHHVNVQHINIIDWLNLLKQDTIKRINDTKKTENIFIDIDKYIKKLQEGEKIVISCCLARGIYTQNPYTYSGYYNFTNISSSYGNTFGSYYYHMLITNKSNIYVSDGDGEIGKFIFHDFDLPTNYINIIKRVCNGNPALTFNTIIGIIEYIKNEQYNKKIVPLYAKEMVEENAILKEKYDQYTKDREELDKSMLNFETVIKPYVDLDKEKQMLETQKKELDEYKEKLKLLAKKLELEKINFENEKKKLAEINLDELNSI